MVVILRNADMKGNTFSGPIKALDEVSVKDVRPDLEPLLEQAKVVIYMPEDCGNVVVLKDTLLDDAVGKGLVKRSESVVHKREPRLVHMLLTFGQLGLQMPEGQW